MRTGLVAQKVGMTRVFTDAATTSGDRAEGGQLQVVAVRSEEKDRLHRGAARLRQSQGQERDPAEARPLRQGQGRAEEEAGRVPRRQGRRARSRRRAGGEPFRAGQFVDVVGTTIGRGFTGSMVRWNFHGLGRATASRSRIVGHGSTGNRQDPGRTFPGKKMAGHYGVERVTTQNSRWSPTDDEKGLLLVVRRRSRRLTTATSSSRTLSKRARHKDAPYPAGLRKAAAEAVAPEAPAELSGAADAAPQA